MNEKDFAKSITQQLTLSTRQLDGTVVQALAAARGRALEAARASERVQVMAAHGSRAGQGVLGWQGGHFSQDHPHAVRLLFVGLALIAAMAGSLYWQQANDDDGNDTGLLDARMLASDLPLYTFLHPDFKSWVDESH